MLRYYSVACSLVLLCLCFLVGHIGVVLFQPLPLHRPVDVVVQPHTSLTRLAYQLHAQAILSHPRYWVWWARCTGVSKQIKTGEYRLEPGTTSIGMLRKMVAGAVLLHPLTVVEGWNFQRMLQELHKNIYLIHDLPEKTALIMRSLGHPGVHPEGRFFPDTYCFPLGTSERWILQRAYEKMQRVLLEEWQGREKKLPYRQPQQALIAASIVEKEAAVEQERSMIARVMLRRLEKNMLLQMDSTIIYALGRHFSGNLSKDDLGVHSRYNTYRYRGLPPTPIALPGRSALHAILHPAQGDMLYFVAKGDGTHVFSSTLSAHRRAVLKYQKRSGHYAR